MKLCCNFGTQNQTVRSDVYLKQKNDCSIIATVIPCTPITLKAGTKGVYLSSVFASSSLLLAKTPVVISCVTINPSNTGWKQEFEVMISCIELKQNTTILNKVTIKIYLTNRFFRFDYAKKKGDRHICLKANKTEKLDIA